MKKSVKKKLNLKKFAIFVVVAFLVLTILINLGKFLFELIMGMSINDTGKTITPSVVSEHDLEPYNDLVAVVNSKGVEFYSNDGEYEADIAFKLYSPYIYTCGKYAVIADIDEANAIVLKNNKQLYKISEKEPIKCVSVNKKGYTAVLTSETGYKSTVVIYDNLGSKVYTWYSGDIYVVDVKLSDNGERFAVAGIKADEGLVSVVKFFETDEEAPVSEVILDSELAYQLEYSGKNATLITDSGLRLISQKGEIKKSFDFSGNSLLCFDIKNTDMMAVAISNSEGTGSKVVILNSSLKEKDSVVVDGVVKMIDENDGDIIASNSSDIYLISSGGRIRAQGSMLKEAQSIKLADDKKHIYTLSGSLIGIYEIEYGRD